MERLRPLLLFVVLLLVGCLVDESRTTPSQPVATHANPTATAVPTVENLFSNGISNRGAVDMSILEYEGLLIPVSVIEREVLIGSTGGTGVTSYRDINQLLNDDQIPIATAPYDKDPCGNYSATPTQGFSWTPGMPYKLASGAINPEYHPGLDYVCNNEGTRDVPVVATAPMVIIKAYTSLPGTDWDSVHFWTTGGTAVGATKYRASCLAQDVLNAAGVVGEYVLALQVHGHMKELYVSAGDQVAQGQAVGMQGSTGRSSGAHDHYAVYLYNITTTALYAVHPHLFTGCS